MKVILIIVGVIVGLMGLSCVGAGAALGAAVGTDGWIESDQGRLDTTTHALVSEVADIASHDDDAAEFFDRFDLRLRIDVEAETDQEAFVGVGRAADVDSYLAGVEHEVVNDIDFDDLDVETGAVPGSREPEPPIDQAFWVEQVNGSSVQVLEWEIEQGSYRFVLMNADGSEGVNVQARFALKIPYVTPAMITLLVAGAVVALSGVAIIILAVRSGSRATPPVAPAAPGPSGDSSETAP